MNNISWGCWNYGINWLGPKIKFNWYKTGRRSAVIPCDWTVEIGRLNAVNPPITLVGSNIMTRTDHFQLVGEKSMNFSQPIFLLKGQKRSQFDNWAYYCRVGGPEFKPRSRRKIILYFRLHFLCHSTWHSNTQRDLSFFHFKKLYSQRDLSCISRLSPCFYNSNNLSMWGG